MIADDGDLFGDGVNVAARLESLSEPGGLCLSRSVRDQVRDKLAYRFEDAGEHEVKNIARPVRVFALSAAAVAVLASVDLPLLPASMKSLGVAAMSATIAACLLVVAGGAWFLLPRTAETPLPAVALPTAAGQAARPVSAHVAPRLSMVVLPFGNLSSDPEQDYFADGIADDLTTDLSRIPGILVIARNTAFTYKGKSVDVRQVGRDLVVRYALEGSVRRVGDQLRVNAQLIDTETGGQLWAERFDGDVARLEALQNEITGRLARSLDLELTNIESERGQRERPTDPDAVDLTFRGWAALNTPETRESLEEAIRFFERALAIDPGHVDALVGLGNALALNALGRYSNDAALALDRAEAAISKAIAAAPRNAQAYLAKGNALRARKAFASAAIAYEAAISLNPNLATAYAFKANSLILAGQSAGALPLIDKAVRLSPQDPYLSLWLYFECHAHMHLGQYDAAIEKCRKSVAINPLWYAYIDLISAYGWKGMEDEARAAIAELGKLMPGYTVQKWASIDWSDNATFRVEYARIVEGLRKAGMREE